MYSELQSQRNSDKCSPQRFSRESAANKPCSILLTNRNDGDRSARKTGLPATVITAKPLTKAAFKSATLSYLWSNLRYGEFWTEGVPQGHGKKELGGMVSSHKESPQSAGPKAEMEKAIEYIVRTIKNEAVGREVIFMIDAPGHDIYAGTLANSDVRWMNEFLADVCKRHNARFIDLTEPFLMKYEIDKEPFNSPYDGHEMKKGIDTQPTYSTGNREVWSGQ